VKKPYRLLLVSHELALQPHHIWDSLTMNTYGLWSEFSKLPHVLLDFHDCRTPIGGEQRDFMLIHAGFSQPIYAMLPDLREKISRKIMLFMEFPNESPSIDHTFAWLPSDKWGTEYIPCPISKPLLHAAVKLPRFSGSILIDHTYWTHQDKPYSAWLKLYEWLEPLAATRRIGQLSSRYATKERVPAWLHIIPELSYLPYLAATSEYETFIPTYFGSYGCSIVDMAARGIRVVVPMVPECGPFCHPSLIERLGLQTFSTRDELMALLAEPNTFKPQLDKCTDYAEIVAHIDAYCQANL